ncbi:MAG: hypothetical protein ACXIVL_01630 [Oceanicaulis sp.]
MARIALIDDDPVEALILRSLLEHAGSDHALAHFTTVEAFADDLGATQADLVILDRRVPPWGRFSETLPLIEASGWRGPVLLITAAPEGVSAASQVLKLIGPVSKSDLLEPQAVARAIGDALTAGG